MSALLLGRLALLALALAAARRARGPGALAVAGAAGAVAALGPGPATLPGPVLLGGGVLAATLLLSFLRAPVHSPLPVEALRSTAALAAGGALGTAFALRAPDPGPALLGGGAVLAALSAWGAEGCRANAETGWRRGLTWSGAVLLPPLAAWGLAELGTALPARTGPGVPVAAGLLAALVWILPFLLERRRVQRELSEEAGLGILPLEDLPVLGNPWRRAREARFGRADERREYVRSALLLAVARQQQRSRSGEAIRLRQLEVLAFRTRVRRAVDARAARYAPVPDELAV